MAMTFTGSIHAAEAGNEQLREILVGAIGCNIAWGLVDAVMYLMSDVVARSRGRRALLALKRAATPDAAREVLEEELPEGVARVMTPADFAGLHRWILAAPEPKTEHTRIRARRWRGAIGVFLLVTLSTFPVVLPLLFWRDDPTRAIRVSHSVALVMLFLIGSALGRYAGLRPWLTGLSMLLIGVVLAGLTILLGG
jgi:VIT1/CCC1 family predicted Fe2+/Mn2+ transporter